MKACSVVLLFAFVVCAQALDDEVKEKLKNIHEDCQKETGADKELLKELRHGEYSGDGSDLKCFPKCFMLKMGFMNDQGKINKQHMIDIVQDDKDKDKMLEIIEECGSKTGKDACDTAFLSYKCYHEHMQKLHPHHE